MRWEAQAGAGVGFLAVGLLQAIKQIRAYRLRNASFLYQHQAAAHKSRFQDWDIYTILLISLSHIICDIVVAHAEGQLSHGVATAVNLERLGVASIFVFYAVVALIVNNTKVLPVPPETIRLLALFAFGQEFLLFYLQRDNTGLESQYHYLLLVPIGVCFGATAAEIVYPKALLPPLVRSMGLVLQGTWFFQIAVSLFSPRWVAQGCSLMDFGEGDYTLSCEGMHLMRGRAVATLQFNCHLAFLLLLLLPLYALMCKLYTSPVQYEPLGDADGHDEAKELYEITDPSRISPEYLRADHFRVIQEDEELEEATPRRSTDTNGFHSVSI